MSEPRWTPANIPNQAGRRAIVTGANSGIGFYTALELARHGAEVILTARDAARGNEAVARIRQEIPAARISVASLDLASMASIHQFAGTQAGQPLDLLLNNAGVMAPPKRKETAEGFELQFGTNVLGHFALTALLLPVLTATSSTSAAAPRVVTIASIAHKTGRIAFDDLQSTRSYKPMGAYQQSKLADLIFAFELERRLRLAESRILSLAAHPGVANTNLFKSPDHGAVEAAMRHGVGILMGLVLNSVPGGALPTLYAATAPEAKGGGYYGPQGFQEMRGEDVGPAKIAPQALDQTTARRLWTVCEELTGLPLLP